MGCCESSSPCERAQPLHGVDVSEQQASAPTCPHIVVLQELLAGQGNEQPDTDWVRLGGAELEEALSKEWVKLVRADWLVHHAKAGGVLARRQDMPLEAYVGLEELQQAGPGALKGETLDAGEWLRVIVLSCPWLEPGHPDPHGENLRLIAKVLKHFVDDSFLYSNSGKPYGVFIDFTALFQLPRTEQEHELFLRAIPALSIFYSHPQTVILKVTQFPDGYPHNSSARYDLPQGANTEVYDERGWCFTESAMSGLVKSANKVLNVCGYKDLHRSGGVGLWEMIGHCKAARNAPLHPGDFMQELNKKTFTNKRADYEEVAKLYSAAFQQRLGSATELDYHELGWDAAAAQQLAQALQGKRLLQTLNLSNNRVGDWGASVLAEALRSVTSLQTLLLRRNGIGQLGAVALGQALQRSTVLHRLEVDSNNVGPEGAATLVQALRSQRLNLADNSLGDRGAIALGEPLQRNTSLQILSLQKNRIGRDGAMALGQALRNNRTLLSLNLGYNEIGDQGAAALGEALRSNSSLQTLHLLSNRIGQDGAVALVQALKSNAALQSLILGDNYIGKLEEEAVRWAAQARRMPLRLFF